MLLVGEFMQLGSKENPDERFNHYLEKTYKKTASLIACCCKAVSIEDPFCIISILVYLSGLLYSYEYFCVSWLIS